MCCGWCPLFKTKMPEELPSSHDIVVENKVHRKIYALLKENDHLIIRNLLVFLEIWEQRAIIDLVHNEETRFVLLQINDILHEWFSSKKSKTIRITHKIKKLLKISVAHKKYIDEFVADLLAL